LKRAIFSKAFLLVSDCFNAIFILHSASQTLKMKLIILAIIIAGSTCMAQSQETRLITLANQFIQSLNKEQQLKTVYPFMTEERYNFHFVPKNDRKGISINELTEAQKQAALRLLSSCLSKEGFNKAVEIMKLETILKALEKRGESDRYRDTGKYFFLIFGEPADGNAWGWRFEGHHISFSFSAKNNQLISGTPGFMGSNPAIVKEGSEKGKQVLKEETNLAFELLRSFAEKQLSKAVISTTAPNDIISFAQRSPLIENNVGIRYAEMNVIQKQKLLALVNLYVHRYTRLFAESMLKDIQRAGLNELRFVWMGATDGEAGKAHYYKIQGPTLLIEYDNSQNNANHVHSVIRDLKNDFGGDVLLEHYKAAH
jgi:hypothetical protein